MVKRSKGTKKAKGRSLFEELSAVSMQDRREGGLLIRPRLLRFPGVRPWRSMRVSWRLDGPPTASCNPTLLAPLKVPGEREGQRFVRPPPCFHSGRSKSRRSQYAEEPADVRSSDGAELIDFPRRQITAGFRAPPSRTHQDGSFPAGGTVAMVPAWRSCWAKCSCNRRAIATGRDRPVCANACGSRSDERSPHQMIRTLPLGPARHPRPGSRIADRAVGLQGQAAHRRDPSGRRRWTRPGGRATDAGGSS
jgi:hypothetical protein